MPVWAGHKREIRAKKMKREEFENDNNNAAYEGPNIPNSASVSGSNWEVLGQRDQSGTWWSLEC